MSNPENSTDTFEYESPMWNNHDNVNHPIHYTSMRTYEPLAVIEDWKLDFHLGNALKYISRAGRKGDFVEDIEKAIFYLQRRITLHHAQTTKEK